ncbi:MAG TPA: VCBS repeat-containing protein [Verrucomicrobiae bacterium]
MCAFLLTIALLVSGLPLAAAEREWTAEQNGVRSRKLNIPPGKTGFTPLDPSLTGFRFTNLVDELSSARNRTLENGAGAATGDFNGDQHADIFICGLLGGSALFENRGSWHFANATANAGLPENMSARGAVFADINGDALEDLLLVTVAEGIRCFTNAANGRFAEHTTSGMRTNLGVTTLALSDVDRNGTLDIYATTYRTDDIRDRARIDIQRVAGKVEVAPALRGRVFLTQTGLFEVGEPDILYLNDGKGNFAPAPQRLRSTSSNSAGSLHDWGLAAAFRDWTGDGWPDLYVCNDYWTPDRIFRNSGRGDLVLVEPEAIPHASENSMGVDFADINADGHLDIFVTDMLSRNHARRQRQATAQATVPPELSEANRRPHYMQNMLFLNRGDGTFAEVAQFAGVAASEWTWQPVFMDIDLDGYVDLLIPAGHSRDLQDLDATEKIRRLQHAWPPTMPADEMQRAFTRELMEHAKLYRHSTLPS